MKISSIIQNAPRGLQRWTEEYISFADAHLAARFASES